LVRNCLRRTPTTRHRERFSAPVLAEPTLWETAVRISLFARLTFGYLVIFFLVAGVSAFAILQLSQFNRVTASILEIDNRILDSEKSLADLLLSQSRYESKFVIAKDESLFNQYVRLKEDF